MLSVLQHFDAFDKSADSEYKVQSNSTPVIFIWIICCFVCAQFFLSFITSSRVTRQLLADSTYINPDDKINITLSITLGLPCYYLHFDSLDSLGFLQQDLRSTVEFIRLSQNHRQIGKTNTTLNFQCDPCYGILPEGSCCNSCEMLKDLFMKAGKTPDPDNWYQCDKSKSPIPPSSEHCLIKGKFTANKVDGSFHICAGKNIIEGKKHNHDLNYHFPNIDFSHHIHSLSFGKEIPSASLPLKNYLFLQRKDVPINHNYILTATPLVYVKKNKQVEYGYEYQSIISRYLAYDSSNGSPGIFVRYFFSPYAVFVTDSGYSLIRTLTSVAGFLSGIFALGSFIDVFRQHQPVSENK